MKYQQLTEAERYMLSALRKQGLNNAQIAKALGRHRTVIPHLFETLSIA